ncbi:lactose ABC transporter permease [Deinococcus aetherius]|uniref:Lactose ABC transporter permease n=1 Tax=Deinococcus aetherius TaxID=200252 RepID=A0ABN6RK19_9DEIO|nr:sugar ABC transporter permease [Deinococcus aetherius]BDP42621.1 lactose ABC transporter permease [Deinococcus aetherius]
MRAPSSLAPAVSAPTRRPRPAPWRSAQARFALLMVAPGLLLFTVFGLYPLASTAYLSLTKYDLLSPPRWVGLENYRQLAQDPVFWTATRNSLLYLLVVPVLVLLPLVLAVLVNRPLRGVGLFRTAYYIPVITSSVVIGVMWKWMYASNGLLNSLLAGAGLEGWVKAALGFPRDHIAWLQGTADAPLLPLFALMLVTLWRYTGYYLVIYLAGLQSVSSEYYEAARIDGATAWQQFRWITVPLMRPYILFVTLLASISALQVFDEVVVMTGRPPEGGGPFRATTTLVYYLYEKAFGQALAIGYASAISLALAVLTLLFGVVYYRVVLRAGRDV